MKKFITLILTLAMITTAAGVFAEDAATGATPGTQQTQEAGTQSTGQGKTRQHRQPGMKGRSQQAQTPETDTQPDAGQPAEQKRGRHGKGSGDAAQAGSQSSGKRGRRSRDAAPAPANSQTPAATDPAAVTENTIDFDAMVTKGAITQAACDRIKAYLQEHPGSTLKDLLSASIITQAEYDALTAAREATAV